MAIPPTRSIPQAPRTLVCVHGWMGNPQRNWWPWLAQQAKTLGMNVIAPQFPDTEDPHLRQWVTMLEQCGANPEQTIFVGHSLGCDAILRFVETLPAATKIPLLVLVAPFIDPDDSRDNKDFGGKPIDVNHVRKVCGKITAIFSSNDPHIPLQPGIEYQNLLGSKIIILKNKGHFTQEDDVLELPQVLTQIKSAQAASAKSTLN